jgi:hypothetical protein
MTGAQRVDAGFEPAAVVPAAPVAAPASGRPRRAGRDRRRPVLRRVSLRPAAFRAARRGSPLAPSGRGALLRYTLSERATVTITVTRRAGRRRAVRVPGLIRLQARRGANNVRLSGRLAGRTLRPARYRLAIGATDPAGNRARSRTLAFRIVRGGGG